MKTACLENVCELAALGGQALLESRLRRLTAERDHCRRLIESLAERVAAQAELLERRACRNPREK